jgi:hypothetical protein
MSVHLMLGLGLLAQGVTAPSPKRVEPPPVRVWLPDTLRPVGDPVRVYVALRDTSHLVVLHVDASGRIRVLFPRSPTDPDLVPGGETFAIAGSEEGMTFRVPAPGLGTVLAVRSRAPFRFDGLTAGSRWDYEHALLLLPTAGNPFAALLDIADRIADGEAYNYDLAAYRTPGAVVARAVASDSVCYSCLTAQRTRTASGATGGEITNSAVALDHSYAAAPGGTVVDCSSATLVDSFCGVQDNSVSTTVEESTVYQSTSVVYPIYTPLFFPLRRFRRPPRAPAPPPPAIALNLRRVPGRIVPPPPRRPTRIVVQQPRAASHPDAVASSDVASDPAAPMSAMPVQRIMVRRAPQPFSAPKGAAPAVGWTTAGAVRRFGTAAAPSVVAAQRAGASGASAQAARPVIVPSRAVARAFANPRH